MGRKLYVGNLAYSTTGDNLKSWFGEHGTVDSASVITDRDTGQSKGFGFVEMGSDDEARKAVTAMDGVEFDGRALKVNEAKPRAAGARSGSRDRPW